MATATGFIRSLDESFQDTLAPGALIVGLAYLAIGLLHTFTPGPGQELLGPVELICAISMLALSAYCRGRRFSPPRAQVVGALVIAPVLLTDLLYAGAYPVVEYPFGLYILIIGTGMIPYTSRWYAGIVVCALGSWSYTIWMTPAALREWVPAGVAMLGMIALGSALHVWRYRYAERMDQLRAEAEKAHDERLRFEERYREMTEHANDMITELDQEGTILYANPAHETLLGYSPAFLTGRSYRNLVVDDGRILARVFRDPPHRRLIKARHIDGHDRTLECNIRPYTVTGGERRLIVTTRDVSERVATDRAQKQDRIKLEALVEERTAALRTSLHELQRSDRLASMGTLAAGIAHQINNPIGSIQVSSEFALLAEGDADERELWRNALRNNREQARRCGAIVASMLQFARNEPTTKAPHDLADIATRVCRQTESYARNRRATLDTSGIEGMLPILGSALEIEQALLNIVRNAIESSSGVKVHVSTKRDGSGASVIVSDNGGGMEASEVEHAFDPFFTTRLARGGTGLGLSVAHGVVTNHNGVLTIESTPGIGTTIVLTLPIHHPAVRLTD